MPSLLLSVIPAEAGIQNLQAILDARLRLAGMTTPTNRRLSLTDAEPMLVY